ncbi:MAG: hypothetical protein ACP5LD_15950 [Desulfomonilaceae bacterium]
MIQKIEQTIQQIDRLVSELETLGAGARLANEGHRLNVVKHAIADSKTRGRVPDQLLVEEMEIQSQMVELEAVKKAEELLLSHITHTVARLKNLRGGKSRERETLRRPSSESSGRCPRRLIGPVKHTKPRAFEIDGSERIEVRTWKELLVKASCSLLTKQGRSKNYPDGFFSESPEGLSRPRKVLDGVYVNAEKNSEMIVDFLERLLKALNRSPQSLIIYAD